MKTATTRTIRLIAIVLCACLPAAATVSIIESSASRLVFRWDAGTLDTASMRDSTREVTRLGLSDENITLGTNNEPEIPGFSVYAGIPPSGAIRVSFVPGPIQTIVLNNPVKRIPAAGKGVLPGAQSIQFVGEWLSEPRYTWFKTMRSAHLVIRPFRCGSDDRTVRMLRSGVCTVEFPSAFAASMPRPPATAYQRMLKRLLLNYEVASTWINPAKKGLLKVADASPFDLSDPAVRTFTIGDGHEGMNSLTTRENGILKIDGAQLLRLFGADAGSLRMGEVALYASWKGELPTLCPAPDAIPPGITEVPLLRVDRNGNGMVDADDYVCAFVTGLSDWSYDTSRSDFSYVLDNYDDNRHYWLGHKPAGDGAAMSRFVQPAAGGDTADYFINRLMFGQPIYRPASGTGLILNNDDVVGYTWARLSPANPEFDVRLDLPKADTMAGGTLRLTMYSGGGLPVRAWIGSDTISSGCTGGSDYSVAAWGDRHLHFLYYDMQDTNIWQLKNFQVEYRAHLVETSDTVRMQVFSFSDTGVRTYRFSGGTGRMFVFRVPLDESSLSLIDTVPAGVPCVWSDSSNKGARYFVCNENGFITLPDAGYSLPQARLSSPTGYAVSNLRDSRNQADYLIVTHPDFLSQAERFVAHKARNGFKRPRIVSINDIYTDFAGGNFDPSALRNFLAFAVRNWETRDSLDYVLLLGNGNYDYKRITTSEPNRIPPAEPGNLCTDDYYGEFTPGPGTDLSLAIGRLPCQSAAQAAAALDKIIAAEDAQTADWGSWRNAMLFVADDDEQNDNGTKRYDGMGHHISSENTCAVVKAGRPAMDIRKVYLFDYPWDAGNHKPECASAILNTIKSGVGYVNYFGHGSDQVWADEHVLTTDMVMQMNNVQRYPIVSSYSCSVGKFDTPDNTTLSEVLMETPQAGAVATFSATRGAAPGDYVGGNENLAKNLYNYLFSEDSDAVLGMAIIAAKARDAYSSNGSIYVLFGDPSLQIMPPARNVSLKITDARQADSGRPLDTLKALQKIRIRGTVLKPTGEPDTQFGTSAPAYVQLGIFNPPQLTGRKDGGADTTVHWMVPGTPVFCSKSPVTGGVFDQTVLLPHSLVFGKPGAGLTAYVWEGSTLGLGWNDSIIFNGTDTSGSLIKDSLGPQISIRPVYDTSLLTAGSVSFTDHLAGSLPLKCEICLNDPSGVNVIGTGPDEGLTMEIPGTQARSNINTKFQFAAGDYRKGSAVISFDAHSLKEGTYTLCITAQDLLGNVSKADFGLAITDSTTMSLDHVFNMPNPMRMGGATRFYFSSTSTNWYRFPQSAQVGGLTDVRITIKIYSLSGKLLKVLRNAQNGEAWDGRDQTGYPLPPDVYLYQATADYQLTTTTTRLGPQTAKSNIQKLVIYPPQR